MLRVCLAVTFALSLGACASNTAEAPPPASASASGAAPGGERAGTVTKITGDIWGVTPADQTTTRFCFSGPLATPALQREGQEVRFSGTPGPIAPNVRLACLPFTYVTLVAGKPAAEPIAPVSSPNR